ncbi:receptor-type tyrosine-protein phosphatase S-like [Tubulanus polymorphus]|uniref:receptor-type tyrosine-protein phosphatase S-like n=1 Tax=Tubulanus polymorphus TaxID=672921 RepID=UPI003DA1E2DF
MKYSLFFLTISFVGLELLPLTNQQATCPPGIFGPRCELQCHCSGGSVEDCTPDGRCISMLCDFGWGDPPYCQKPCDQGWFGESCLLECHCPTGDNCSKINGLCDSGKCNPNFGGAGCQIHLPKMEIPPTVANITCDTVWLTWRKWNDALDMGDKPVGWYQILYSDSVDTTIRSSSMIPEPTLQNVTWSTNGLIKGRRYTFQIKVFRKDFGKAFPGLIGPKTDEILPQCPAQEPGVVNSATYQQIPPDTARITWSAPTLHPEDVIGYTIKYYRHVVGTCNTSYPGRVLFVNTLPTASAANLTNLQPWSTYHVEIFAQGRDGLKGASTNISITTDKAAPTGRVRNLRTQQKSSSTITITWDRPECIERNGPFSNYQIKASHATVMVIVTSQSFMYQNLQPSTDYTFSVRYVNAVGPGPFNSITERSSADTSAPGPVSNIQAASPTSNSVSISWDKPVKQGNTVTSYTIQYTKISTGNCDTTPGPLQTTKSASNMLVASLTGLKPWSTYKVQVFAIGVNNQAGTATELLPSPKTLPAVPATGVTNIRSTGTTNSQLNIAWDDPPCADRNGAFRRYKLMIKRGASLIVDEFVQIKQKIQPGLQAYTDYIIQVAYVNEIGVGPFSEQILKTAQGVPSPPQNVRARAIGASRIRVDWTAPKNPNGVLKTYSIIVNDGNQVVQNNPVAATVTNSIITNLQPLTTYTITMTAATDFGTSIVSNAAQATTLATGAPSMPTGIKMISRTATAITIGWSEPISPNGVIQSYQVNVTYVQTKSTTGQASSTISIDLPADARRRIVDGLHQATLYKFAVTARTTSFGQSALVELWTEVGSPPVPDTPEQIGVTATNITLRIKPVLATNGPITSYRIMVEEVASRRRRATPRVAAELLPDFFAGNPSRTFVVGDDSTYNGYQNAALKPATKYKIGYSAVSSNDGSTKETTVWMAPVTSESITATNNDWIWIVIVVIVILIIIIIIIVIVVLCLRKKRKSHDFNKTWLNNYSMNQDKFDTMSLNIRPYGKWSDVTNLGEPRHVVHMKDPIKNPDPNIIPLESEYHKLPTDPKGTLHVASRPENRIKNRFQEFLPYDHSRVKVVDPHHRSDYFNANYVDGYRRQQAYIAAQSPFNGDTINDFWKLVYQDNVAKIVLMCEPMEYNVFKCEKYWPDEGTHTYGACVVHVVNSQQFAHYIVKTFEVFPQGQTKKTVHHYQFTGWPPRSIPSDPIPFLEFVQKVRSHASEDIGIEPILVHGGTGVSRSAVFIAVDAMLDKAANENGEINLFRFCCKMREQRFGMVRTLKHYLFIYDALFEALITSPTFIDIDMRAAYKTLVRRNHENGHSYLQEQYKVLCYYTPELSEEQCKVAVRAQNRSKNRYDAIIPPDAYRPVLKTPGGVNRTDYINALVIDSFLVPMGFIITQTPLAATVIDFWKLVYDYNVRTIVTMHDHTFKDDTVVDYWPSAVDTAERQGPFFVSVKTIVKEKEFVFSRRMNLTNSLKPNAKAREIKQFQFSGEWHMYDKVPRDREAMVQLLETVIQHRTHHSIGPVLVHCVDGAGRSGMFCSLMNLIEKMRNDEYADVFHTIKHIKRRRPQVVNDYEMYKFVFKTLWDYINLHMRDALISNSGYVASNSNYRLSSTNSVDYTLSNGRYPSRLSNSIIGYDEPDRFGSKNRLSTLGTTANSANFDSSSSHGGGRYGSKSRLVPPSNTSRLSDRFSSSNSLNIHSPAKANYYA